MLFTMARWPRAAPAARQLGPDSINSKPIGIDSIETEHGKAISGELMIAGSDAAEILEHFEAALAEVAVLEFIRP
jgi:hypothetical protein